MSGVDLHLHSSCSDGKATPAEIAARAVQAGIDCISLTDHGMVDGLGQLRRCLEGSGLELVDGVELVADVAALEEIHILGYGIDTGNQALLEGLKRVVRLKRKQLAGMVEQLQQQGVRVSCEEIPDWESKDYVGRPALAQLLVSKGVVRTRRAAFDQYLTAGGSAYVPLGAMSPAQCVDLIHQAGGLAVLAHPNLRQLDTWVRPLVAAGLDGIEVYRSSVGGNDELYAEMVTQDFGLVATGGSDWHGRDSDGPLGAFSVPRERLLPFFEKLANR